jgi:ABC-type transporter Mla MlaB component
MFVRNPTKDWSEIGVAEQPLEGGYDKQALKAMIERKRQNDFVRKREFDQLRKLRNRDPAAIANMARPSYFQTSVPTDQDGRAVTLKKIDEIEAQMSKQWWKGKQENAPGAANNAAILHEAMGDGSLESRMGKGDEFPTTAASNFPKGPDSVPGEFAETQLASGMANIARAGPAMVPLGGAGSGVAASHQGFSSSEMFAMDDADLQTDPELEEAAIRFANGDYAGAENGLLAALRAHALQPEVVQSWVAALLDLYRAINNHEGFDRAVKEFGIRFGRVTPQWAALADAPRILVGLQGAPELTRPGTQERALMWDAPATLDLAAMESLREVLSVHPMPWRVGWSEVATIRLDAVPLLGALFSSLCSEQVTAYFSSAETLGVALRTLTPSGNPSIHQSIWQVRLDALRAMRMQDEFELAALDFCVTYGVAPPNWIEPACQLLPLETEEINAADAPATMPMVYPVATGAPNVELWGEVLGDASQELAQMDPEAVKDGQVIVACQGLVRVDFSAAGSILNWVAMRQAEGAQVQFRGVNRLVAAFFSVIGINEHARVIPRSI